MAKPITAAAKVLDFRIKNNLTLAQLAERCNVHESTICRIEQGHAPTTRVALAVASACGFAVEEFAP